MARRCDVRRARCDSDHSSGRRPPGRRTLRGLAGQAVLAALLAAARLAGTAQAQTPPAPGPLTGAEAKRAEALGEAVVRFWREAKFTEAQGPAREILTLYETSLGPDDWRTADV